MVADVCHNPHFRLCDTIHDWRIGIVAKKAESTTAATKQPSLQEKGAKALLRQWLADDRRLIGGNMASAALRTVATHLDVSLDAMNRGKVREVKVVAGSVCAPDKVRYQDGRGFNKIEAASSKSLPSPGAIAEDHGGPDSPGLECGRGRRR